MIFVWNNLRSHPLDKIYFIHSRFSAHRVESFLRDIYGSGKIVMSTRDDAVFADPEDKKLLGDIVDPKHLYNAFQDDVFRRDYEDLVRDCLERWKVKTPHPEADRYVVLISTKLRQSYGSQVPFEF